uniref:Uncharacterized protein n=1 Tax=Romanomermis culicivorax TaxID=13658 RepID=A0A915I5W5_ROMCU
MVQPTISVVYGPPRWPPPDIQLLLRLIFSISINTQEQYATWAKRLGPQNDILFFANELLYSFDPAM